MASPSLVCTSRMFKHLEFSASFKYFLLFSDSLCNSNLNKLQRWKCSRKYCTSTSHKSLVEETTKSGSESTTATCDENESDVIVKYYRGLPQVTVPLPSRKEKCRFTLRPITNTVGDFLAMLKQEDRGIDRVSVLTKDGVRIASSNTIEVLLEEKFQLVINDNKYLVNTPSQERLTKEEIRRLSDVKNLVHQLYEALNVEEHQLQKEREINSELETLRQELLPMEAKRHELDLLASRKTNVLTWVGLGLMSVQFGILARLTWWEYSWDIMEPVTYFVTYGTAIAGYAYFVLTRQEYVLPDVKDRQHLLTLHKKARQIGLDLSRYNQLKDKISWLEKDLRRLRDPLTMRLPPSYTQQFQRSLVAGKETALDKLKRFVNKNNTKANAC